MKDKMDDWNGNNSYNRKDCKQIAYTLLSIVENGKVPFTPFHFCHNALPPCSLYLNINIKQRKIQLEKV